MLLAVAEHGGVAAAARALSFTPPAVSQQLAALERQLGVSLVDRSGRTAVLTLPGRRLAEHAQEVLAGLEAAEADVTALARPDGAAQGVVTIATILTLGRSLLPGVLGQLARNARSSTCASSSSSPRTACRGSRAVTWTSPWPESSPSPPAATTARSNGATCSPNRCTSPFPLTTGSSDPGSS